MILQATVISRWIFSHFLGRYEIVSERRVICMDDCEQKRVNLSEFLRFIVFVIVIATVLRLKSIRLENLSLFIKLV